MDKDILQKTMMLVVKERERQEKKWGDQHHTPEMWAAIEAEELGEVAKAGLDYNSKKNKYHHDSPTMLMHADFMLCEWIQVAAVALAAIEDIAIRHSGGENAFYDLTVEYPDAGELVIIDTKAKDDDDPLCSCGHRFSDHFTVVFSPERPCSALGCDCRRYEKMTAGE